MSSENGDVNIVADVAQALSVGDLVAARLALAPIQGQTIATRPILAAPQRQPRYPRGSGIQTRSPTKSVLAAVYRRDHFTCMYCARQTVVLPVLGLISELLPTEFPGHPHWKRDIVKDHRNSPGVITEIPHL